MNEDLKITTVEEYKELETAKVKLPSNAVFLVKQLDSESMVSLLRLLPDEGLEEREDTITFVKDNFGEITDKVIKPSIVKPKIDKLIFTDAVDLLLKLMDLSGLTEEEAEERESFPGGPDDTGS